MSLLFAMLLALSTAQGPDPAALERTARQIESEVIAPCCWRQQVSIHSSPAAEEMKADIRKRLADGQTHQEILDAYYEQYGAQVLVVPPAKGVSWLLYITRLALAEMLQEVLSEQLAPHGFVTLFLCILDPRTHRLEYVNAGHEPPALLVPNASLVSLESTGPPLGMGIPVPLRDAAVTLAPGAALCCWSDGIPESIKIGSRPPQDFTRECLLEQLQVLRDADASTIVTRVFEAVDAFVGTRQAQDDGSMLVLRRLPDGRR